ncbi:MAG: hypothetical protein VX346_14385 [Planctomycetota bacterium]|nr:hypothetical protein [Planctomycetota bacterium]
MSKSLGSDICAYVQTRLLLPRIGALASLVLLAAWCHSMPQSLPADWRDALIDMLLAALLLTQFRIWDDLADVPLDRRIQPNRTLCNTSHRRSFQVIVIVLAAAAASLVTNPADPTALSLLGGLTLLMICWYWFPPRPTWSGLNYHIVLLKYPVFILLIGSRGNPLSGHTASLRVVVAVYLLLCVFEVFHDRMLRQRTRFCVLASVEAFLLICVGISTGSIP